LTDMASRQHAKHTDEALLVLQPSNGKTGLVFFLLSLFFHGLFFAALIYFQDFRLPKPMPPVIQVDLVSFDPEPALDDTLPTTNEKVQDEGVSTQVKPVEKKPPAIEHKKADISLKTKPKNLKKLIEQKKKEKKDPVEKKEKPKEDPPKAEEKSKEPATRTEPETKQEDQDQARIAEILKKLQKQVNEKGPPQKAAGNNSGGSAGRRAGSRPIDIYNQVMSYTFGQNWVFNDTLAKMDENLEARIFIKILKNGEIRDIFFETKSGNRYLDESAKRAILKSNPLPPLPAGMSSYDLIVIFGPKGLK
jgi:colicin import membrane protein